MKSFEEYLAREQYYSDCDTRAALRRNTERKLTRMERKRMNGTKVALILSVIVWAVFIVLLLTAHGVSDKPEPIPTTTEKQAVQPIQGANPTGHCILPIEPEIEVVKPLYYDVPLDHETQDLLRSASEEAGIEFELALAVIKKETDFRNIMGDGGDSYGYMQVQPKWHSERMERLGVTDLTDPLSNFRVGCDYLAELLGKYPLAYALTAYNSGSAGLGEYSEAVMTYMEEFQESQCRQVTVVRTVPKGV